MKSHLFLSLHFFSRSLSHLFSRAFCPSRFALFVGYFLGHRGDPSPESPSNARRTIALFRGRPPPGARLGRLFLKPPARLEWAAGAPGRPPLPHGCQYSSTTQRPPNPRPRPRRAPGPACARANTGGEPRLPSGRAAPVGPAGAFWRGAGRRRARDSTTRTSSENFRVLLPPRPRPH